MQKAFTIHQAVNRSNQLSIALNIAKASAERLNCVRQILPLEMGQQLQFGSFQDHEWTLMIKHQASLSKIKQQVPLLLAHLNLSGLPTQSIKLKLYRETDR